MTPQGVRLRIMRGLFYCASRMYNRVNMDKFMLALLMLSGAFILAGGVVLAIAAPRFSEPVILHVDPVIGVDRVGSVGEAISMFGIGVVMVAINLILAKEFLERMPRLAYVSAAAGALVALLTLIATAYVASLN